MSRRPIPQKRPIALLALLAIVLHAALPFLHGLLQAPARGFYTTNCALGAPAQLAWVALDDTPPAPAGQPPRCPLCLAGAHLSLQPITDSPPALRNDLRQALLPEMAAWNTPAIREPGYQARAPPALPA